MFVIVGLFKQFFRFLWCFRLEGDVPFVPVEFWSLISWWSLLFWSTILMWFGLVCFFLFLGLLFDFFLILGLLIEGFGGVDESFLDVLLEDVSGHQILLYRRGKID